MKKLLTLALVGLASSGLALSQTTTTTDDATDLGAHSPRENAGGGSVRARAPGNLVNEARARHSELAATRLAYQRGSGSLDASTSSNNETSASTSGSGGLTDLLGSLLGSGGLSNITSLLGSGGFEGLLGGGSGAATGDTTTNPNIPSNLTPEAIALLESAGFNINDLFPSDTSDGSGTPAGGGAKATEGRQADSDSAVNLMLDRTWKGHGRAQTTDTPEPSFRIRWMNSLLTTFLTSLTVGLQTPAVIQSIEDKWIRPLFEQLNPPANP
jgi:hypothetical protein